MESRFVGGVELLDQLFTITSQRTCFPLQSMSDEEIVDLGHSGETSRKDPLLQCKCPSHDSFVIQELCIGLDLILPVDTPLVELVGNRGESTSW